MQYDSKLFRTTFAKCQTGDTGNNAREAARKIRDDFASFSASLVMFFASTDYDPDVLAREMQDAFPGAVTMGCSTAGEGVDNMLLTSSVVAMAYARDVFSECESAIVLPKGADTAGGADMFTSTPEAMRYLVRNLGVAPIDLDYRQYIGFMLCDSVSPFSERVLEELGELSNVLFVGGVAGDDYKFSGLQRVFYNGRSYASAVVVALWKPKNGFDILKTQAAELTNKTMIINKADEDARIIWEFDGQPAAAAYAKAIGKPGAMVDITDFDEHPMALSIEGTPFMRALIKNIDNKGLQMFLPVRQDTSLTVTNAGDILTVTRKEIEAMRSAMPSLSGILHVNCCSRHTALSNRGQVEEFGNLFAGVPSIAFSSYGEVFVNLIAMTSVMVLFK